MKENTLFKLDLLETYYLQKPTRFGVTKQMMRSEKYQSKAKKQMSSMRQEKQKHKLLLMTKNEAFEMIKELKLESFQKKLFFTETSLTRSIVKVLKKEKQSLSQKLQAAEADTETNAKVKEDIQAQIDAVNVLLEKDSEVLESNIKHKIFKELIKHFPTYIDVKNDKFDSIPESEIVFIRGMKEKNPYKSNGNAMNNLLSKVYAEKTVKQALDHIQTMEIIWGPKKYTKTNNEEELNEFDDGEGEDDEDSEDDSDEEVEQGGHAADGEHIELDDDAYEKLYEGYKDQLAASSDEEDEEDELALNPAVDYNEITDDEVSDDDEAESDPDLGDSEDENVKEISAKEKDHKRSIEEDDFFASEPSSKKTKLGMKDIQLPILATGYYSGGESDEDERDDAIVKDITEPRKNRRGQRARQKIWEKKYGKTAKHKVKEHQRELSDRERLRAEYEVRKTKREAKERVWREREAEKEAKRKVAEEKSHTLHPSWEAKLKQQESLKAKFSGKKITFD
jgi:hypothetical protein